MDLALDKYTEKGLYLVFPDSTSLELTRSNIERLAAQYWDDPASIPPDVKTSAEIKRCDISPVKEKPGLCDALRPVLPFLKEVDKYISFDKVTAIYKGDKKEDLYVSETTMQEALKYVSILSLMYYCQVGRQYWKYFHGIIPFMSPKEIALRIYLNMYWFHKGDKEAINKLIAKFKEEITFTTQHLAKRLNLICKNDAFLNAFVSTHIATEFLSMDIDKILEKSFATFDEAA